MKNIQAKNKRVKVITVMLQHSESTTISALRGRRIKQYKLELSVIIKGKSVIKEKQELNTKADFRKTEVMKISNFSR